MFEDVPLTMVEETPKVAEKVYSDEDNAKFEAYLAAMADAEGAGNKSTKEDTYVVLVDENGSHDEDKPSQDQEDQEDQADDGLQAALDEGLQELQDDSEEEEEYEDDNEGEETYAGIDGNAEESEVESEEE